MTPSPKETVTLVGAGLAGGLLAVVLARRGFDVRVFERRPDPRTLVVDSGRSINLALSARGIHALAAAGVMDRIRPLLIAMPGRCIHLHDGSTSFLPYGKSTVEVNYSVSRASLSRALIEAADALPNVEFHFDAACIAYDTDAKQLLVRIGSEERRVDAAPVCATDGAGSAVRESLEAAHHVRSHEEPLDHDYRELTVPAEIAGPLETHALHIWPRGGFMLIALPNLDGSFTATLFLPRTGANSFDALRDDESILAFFRAEFPSALPLLPSLLEDFRTHPQGRLGTLHCAPWHIRGNALLLGDAAHAMVPFHGQGMNCAFEDVAVFDRLLDSHDSWETLFADFERERRPDTAAIAAMALENYGEMRETVLDPAFQRRKRIGLELEQRFPDRFIPRYSMVTFHPEIGYAEALRRGAAQEAILQELDERFPDGRIDAGVAAELLSQLDDIKVSSLR